MKVNFDLINFTEKEATNKMSSFLKMHNSCIMQVYNVLFLVNRMKEISRMVLNRVKESKRCKTGIYMMVNG